LPLTAEKNITEIQKQWRLRDVERYDKSLSWTIAGLSVVDDPMIVIDASVHSKLEA